MRVNNLLLLLLLFCIIIGGSIMIYNYCNMNNITVTIGNETINLTENNTTLNNTTQTNTTPTKANKIKNTDDNTDTVNNEDDDIELNSNGEPIVYIGPTEAPKRSEITPDMGAEPVKGEITETDEAGSTEY